MQRAVLDFVEGICFVYARSGAKNPSIKWPDQATPLQNTIDICWTTFYTSSPFHPFAIQCNVATRNPTS